MMKVRDVMSTEIVSARPETPLMEAIHLMADEHYSGLPVVSPGGTILGVLSASDVLEFSASGDASLVAFPGDRAGAWPEPIEWREGEDPPRYFAWDDGDRGLDFDIGSDEAGATGLEEHVVGELMTRTVVTVSPDDDLAEAARRMLSTDVHRLLAVEHDRLVGVITTMDIVRAVAGSRVAAEVGPAEVHPATV